MKFSDLWTEKDGLTLDIKRVLLIPVSLVSPIVLQVVDVIHNHPFVVKDFCEGIALVLTAAAALLAGHAFANGENSNPPKPEDK